MGAIKLSVKYLEGTIKFCIFVENRERMLNYEEFYEDVWDYVSGKIVDDHFFFAHEDMMRAITKDMFDSYCSSESSVHPKIYGRMIESFFYNLNKFKLPEKETDYNSYD